MSTVKKYTLTRPSQYWKHLRDWKRDFWKRERRAHNSAIPALLKDDYSREEFESDSCSSEHPCSLCGGGSNKVV